MERSDRDDLGGLVRALHTAGATFASFEGTAVLLAIRQHSQHNFLFTATLTLAFQIVLTVSFTLLCSAMKVPLLQTLLSSDSTVFIVARLAISLNLLLSLPLAAYPATFLIEKRFFRMTPTRRRFAYLARLLLTLIAFAIGILLVFLGPTSAIASLTGFLLCLPLTLILPLCLQRQLRLIRRV